MSYFDNLNQHTGAPIAPSSEDLGVDDHSLQRATDSSYAWFDAVVPWGLVRHRRVPIDTVEPSAEAPTVRIGNDEPREVMPGDCDHEPVLYDEDVLPTLEPPAGFVYVSRRNTPNIVGTPVALVWIQLSLTRKLVIYACRHCGAVYSAIVEAT